MFDLNEQERAVLRAMSRLKKIHIYPLYPGFSPGEGQLLAVVARHPEGITVTALAHEMEMPTPAISRMMRGMEEKGLISRTILPSDRRNIIVTATPKGVQTCEELHACFHRFFCEVLEPVATEDIDHLLAVWNQIMDRMDDMLSRELAARKTESLEENA